MATEIENGWEQLVASLGIAHTPAAIRISARVGYLAGLDCMLALLCEDVGDEAIAKLVKYKLELAEGCAAIRKDALAANGLVDDFAHEGAPR